MNRAYYDSPIFLFLGEAKDAILGKIASRHAQEITHPQTNAWSSQIDLLKTQLIGLERGHIFFEFVIPRMGKRADVVLLIDGVVFVIEFKIGAMIASSEDRKQVEGYALDLKYFHEGSHSLSVIPVLIATSAAPLPFLLNRHEDRVFETIVSNGLNLFEIVTSVQSEFGEPICDPTLWMNSAYRPSPTIIEAAQALYSDHAVEEIARSDAGAKNLAETTQRIREIVAFAKENKRKSICFVTGVPGSGKTLIGLDLATSTAGEEQAVFLSGNGPLVDVLREALVRDEVSRLPGTTKAMSSRKVRSFIQNIHHFRDEALQNDAPPNERVVVFDEAQRAWNAEQTTKFMINKRGQSYFNQSEPEFLIGYMDRHESWCVIVALIGGGQEINTGEAGLGGWRDALKVKYQDWDVYFSDRLNHAEYSERDADFSTLENETCSPEPALHLTTSMRSFRAESISSVVHHLIQGNAALALDAYKRVSTNYPIRITRNLDIARKWVTQRTRGVETKGIIVSSGASRLKPHGIFTGNEISAPYWFLNPPDDVRSCHALEDVATEFDIQGLELDWTIVGWDADLRFVDWKFEHWSFRGTRWQRVNKDDARNYLENAYRVLLTRARQGMVIFVPEGSSIDSTRNPSFYDGTYEFLRNCGFPEM